MEKSHLNCWEFMDCGREPNGKNVSQYGVCQVAIETTLNGVHNGKNGGRCCWIIVEYSPNNSDLPFCTGTAHECINCDFYKKVFNPKALLATP
ncbi:MAG: hypothetical protein D3910_28050 [Candidatus Electrothrix sp. ATG2]|nr:hypothetical protein [Candidatus Electrothrix sp. ATG2]